MASQPFYSVHCVVKVDPDSLVSHKEVYLLGPQFCGGEKHVIARVYPEALVDARASEDNLGLPDAVQAFLDWVEAESVIPVQRKRP